MFGILLQMVPGLEDRLMEGSNEDVVSIADTVHPTQHLLVAITYSMNSFKRVSPAQDPTTLKV